MRHFLPLLRMFEHLGDEGLLDAAEVPSLMASARHLNQQGFTNEVIIAALFNWHFHRNPDLRSEIDRFRENEEEHTRLMKLRIPKGELLKLMQPHLNGEWEDIATAFATVTDDAPLTSDQAIFYIPSHHPKAIDALVLVYLGHAKTTSC